MLVVAGRIGVVGVVAYSEYHYCYEIVLVDVAQLIIQRSEKENEGKFSSVLQQDFIRQMTKWGKEYADALEC